MCDIDMEEEEPKKKRKRRRFVPPAYTEVPAEHYAASRNRALVKGFMSRIKAAGWACLAFISMLELVTPPKETRVNNLSPSLRRQVKSMMEAPDMPLTKEALKKLGSNRGVKYQAMQRFQYEQMYGRVPLQIIPWRDESGTIRSHINDDNAPILREQLVDATECVPVMEHVMKEIKKRNIPMVPHTSSYLACFWDLGI
jgi:hypothetical protein